MNNQTLLGHLIRIRMAEKNVSVSKANEFTGLSTAYISLLLKNEIYVNNIPIKLIESLFRLLDIQLTQEVKDVIIFSCKKLKQIEEDTKVPKNGWNELWENEEAWNKYINRLEELLKEPQPEIQPFNGQRIEDEFPEKPITIKPAHIGAEPVEDQDELQDDFWNAIYLKIINWEGMGEMLKRELKSKYKITRIK